MDRKGTEQNQGNDVDNRGDKGVGNHGGVEMANLCQNRQNRADELCQNNRSKQRQRYDETDVPGVAFDI